MKIFLNTTNINKPTIEITKNQDSKFLNQLKSEKEVLKIKISKAVENNDRDLHFVLNSKLKTLNSAIEIETHLLK